MAILSNFTAPLLAKIAGGAALLMAIALGVQTARLNHWHGVADERQLTIDAVNFEIRKAFGIAATVRLTDPPDKYVRALGQTLTNVRLASGAAIVAARANADRVAADYASAQRRAENAQVVLVSDLRQRLSDRLRGADTQGRTNHGDASPNYRAASPACAGSPDPGTGCSLVSEADLGITADNLGQLQALIGYVKETSRVATAPVPASP